MQSLTPENTKSSPSEPCQHDWEDLGRIQDGYSRGYCIVAYGYRCRKCGEEMEIEKDVS